MARRPIPLATVEKLVSEGKGVSEIARELGFSKSGISVACKRLGLAMNQDLTLRTAVEIADKKLDCMAQLLRINEVVNDELTYLQKLVQKANEDNRAQLEKRMLRHTREIRGQLRLFLNIAKTLYDVEQVAEFQKIVLEEIGKADEETRQRIIERLNQRRAARGATSLS